MRSRSSLSPRILSVGLFIFTLTTLLLAPVYSKYLGSGQGRTDTARSNAVDSVGNAHLTAPDCSSCTSVNRAANSVGQVPTSDSATGTPAATLLAQFSQQGPKLVGTSAPGNANQGGSVYLSSDRNTAIVGGPQDGGGAAWAFTTTSQCNTASFGAKTDFGAGPIPFSVAVGDFNGDGKLDLAVANGGSSTASILLGTGTGSFGAKTDFGAGPIPYSAAVGDFNGDGKLDLVVTNSNNGGVGTVSILLGTGTGSFGAKTDFGTGSNPQSVAVGDFNGDGKLDLAVANVNSDTVSILLGTGTGSFGPKTDFATACQPFSVTVGEFSGDGKLDLAVGNCAATVSILLGTGTGNFGPKTEFATGGQPFSVKVGDFNGDGKLDLATANINGDTVSILLGSGTGSFGAKTDFGTGSNPQSVAVGDFNGDGKLDLATANALGNTVSILLGTGTGSFGAKTDFGTGSGPVSVAAGDFNGDGKRDLAVANVNSATVSILLNTCNSTPTCPIAPLTSLANLATRYCSDLTITQQLEANPIRTDLYSQAMQTGIANFQARVRAAGFTGTFLTGTFRTRAYQAHLREVWDKNRPVAPPPECSEISSHFIDHAFGGKPGSPDSTTPGATQHTVGRAIDINIKGIRASGIDTRPGGQLDQIATQGPFGFHRTDPGGDPVHFEALFVPVQSPQQCPGTSSDAEARSTTSDAIISGAAVAPVTVKVSEQSINGHPVYSYRVVNGSSQPVVSATIGYDQPNDNPELAVPPLGWDYYDGLPQSSAASPTGWSASVVPTEESSYLQLTWASADSTHFIAPGQSSDGFSVVLPNADNSYKNSYWTVVLADGTMYSASLEPLNAVTGDTVQFSQAVYTVNKNSGHATITVTRAGSSANSATVHFTTSDGTAEQPTNYTGTSGSLIFAPGETGKSFNVQIINNVYLEPDQTVNLNLSNASGLSLGNLSFATLVINHNSLSSSPAQLILETSGPALDEAAALDSLLFLRDPFQVVNGANLLNLGADRNTRVIVFVMNLQLAQGETASSVVVNLIDGNNQSYDVAAEVVRLVPNFDFTQVIFRLPDNLSAGTCTIVIKAHGQVSNLGTIRIRI